MGKTYPTYMVKSEPPSAYTVLKFTDTGDFEGQYRVVEGKRGGLYCDCPYGSRPQTRGRGCRHVAMIPLFKKKKAIDRPKHYCYDTDKWFELKDVE